MNKIIAFLFGLLLLPLASAKGAGLLDADSLQASVLTCSPCGNELYEYYGHTALLIRDITKCDDLAFNYGLFDYNASYFIWNFIRGECNYMVGAVYLTNFLPEYEERGSFVREMQLNLTSEEVHKLAQSLIENCEPENATYHYNFFYDNCATRICSQIKCCINGQLVYTNKVKTQSLRDIVHQYCKDYTWSRFGQDLLLGAEADRTASRESQQFAPLYLENDLKTAFILQKDGKKRPLVSHIRNLVNEDTAKVVKGYPVTPEICSVILLLLTLFISGKDLKKAFKDKCEKKPSVCWQYDLLLLLLQGLMGCVITFLFFFSIHPTVDSNWLVAILNPLPLVFLYWAIRSERKGLRNLYYPLSALILLLFLLCNLFIPQYFGPAILVLALCLLLRSITLTLILGPYPFRRVKAQK